MTTVAATKPIAQALTRPTQPIAGPYLAGSASGSGWGLLPVYTKQGDHYPVVAYVDGPVSAERTATQRLLTESWTMLQTIKELEQELDERYDGAPDSGNRWTGDFIRRMRESILRIEGAL